MDAADLFIKAGMRESAIEVLEEGIRAYPDSKELRDKYESLSEKQV
ncbi:hypothetical protein [Thermogymnomonas acidicola]|nr:hypothetical protein [Thermogymnomonas acidicola]